MVGGGLKGRVVLGFKRLYEEAEGGSEAVMRRCRSDHSRGHPPGGTMWIFDGSLGLSTLVPKGTRGRCRGLICISGPVLRSQMVQNCSELVSKWSKTIQMVQNQSKWSKIAQNGLKIVEIDAKSVKIGQNGSKRVRNRPKSVKIGQNRTKIGQHWTKW